MKAIIFGGTSGIGQATSLQLISLGWTVMPFGRADLDFNLRAEWGVDEFLRSTPSKYDAMVFSAGDLSRRGISAFAFPLAFYRLVDSRLLNDGAKVVAVSSVAADRPAKLNSDYAAAHGAMQSYIRTLQNERSTEEHRWSITCIKFDLVFTRMMQFIPRDTMVGRPKISAEEAASQIVEMII